MSTTIHAAMTAVWAEVPQVSKQSLVLEEIYDKLRAVLTAKNLLVSCSVQDVFLSSDQQLRVTAEWSFRYGNGDQIVSKAMVVLPCQKLSNELLLKAQKLSLLQVFFLTLNPVDEVNKHLASNGQKPLQTADQLKPGPTPKELADASKKRKDWLDAIEHLNPEDMAAWEHHKLKLKDLPGQDEEGRKELFEEMVSRADFMNVGYNREQRKFFRMATA